MVQTPSHEESLFGSPHLLSVEQFTIDSINELFRIADLLQPVARRQKVCRVLEGALLANLFFEASTRTRISFGAAFCRMGGAVCDTTGFTFSSMSKGESIYDTSRVISGYVDAMVIRHPQQGAVADFARATNIPVINGGDGPGEHPSQALLDLYTIRNEFRRLKKDFKCFHIALVGDLKRGRTVHSLFKLLALYSDVRVTLVSPMSLKMPDAVLRSVGASSVRVDACGSLEGIKDADVVYATRVQTERVNDGETKESYSPDFQINASVIERYCKSDTVIMHPLPRDGRPEANDLATDLNHDPRLAIFRQADCGIPIRMAIFAIVLGVTSYLTKEMREVRWARPHQIGPDEADFYNLSGDAAQR